MTVTTGLFIWFAATALIVWLHFWLCRKIVFIELKNPVRSDLIDCQYQSGGPLMILPIINIVFLVATWYEYLVLSGRIKKSNWEEKPLKH